MMQQEFINALLDDVGDMRGGLDTVATHVTLPELLAAHRCRTRDDEEEERCEKLKVGVTRPRTGYACRVCLCVSVTMTLSVCVLLFALDVSVVVVVVVWSACLGCAAVYGRRWGLCRLILRVCAVSRNTHLGVTGGHHAAHGHAFCICIPVQESRVCRAAGSDEPARADGRGSDGGDARRKRSS